MKRSYRVELVAALVVFALLVVIDVYFRMGS
jgi:hypothetical protein